MKEGIWRGGLVIALMAAIAVVSVSAATARSARGDRISASAASNTLTMGVQQGYNVLPVFVALRHGFLKQAGITNVSFSVFSSLPALLAAVAQGQLALGYQSIPPVVSYDRVTTGPKLKIVAGMSWDSILWFAKDGSGALTAAKAGWKQTVQSWKGKKIGLPAPQGLVKVYTDGLLQAAGMSPSDVTYQVVGVGPPAVAALQQGLVDFITGDSLTTGLLADAKLGYPVLSLPNRQAPPNLLDMPSGIAFASETQVTSNPKLYSGFAQAMVKARAFMANPKHKKDILDLLVRKVGLDQTAAESIYPVGVPVFAHAKVSPQSLGKFLKLLVSTNLIAPPAPAYNDITFDFAR